MSKFTIILISLLFGLASCASNQKYGLDSPSWYNNPKQNDSESLYGVAEGYTLEEATKYALADAAARLIVTVSSESNLIREENQVSSNEEIRQNVRQSVEKISFTNFKTSQSKKLDQRFFVEVKIERNPFINTQKERLSFMEKQVADLEKNSVGKNPIQRRNALIKILELEKQIELVSRIISGAGDNINLKDKLDHIAYFQNQFSLGSDKIEFYFDETSPKELTKIIRTALNREKMKIVVSRNASNQNQVNVKIRSSKKTNEIYGAQITKLEIDFENFAGGKLLASNSVEVSGSSTISEKESYSAALGSFEEKVTKDGILKILGIIN